MPKYIYVEAQVGVLDVAQQAAYNNLLEQATGKPVADVITPVHAGQISFRHTVVEASSNWDALGEGQRYFDKIGGRKPNTAMNDYVVCIG